MDSLRPYARELGDFLRARRSRLRPHDVGMVPGGRRKVTGLRREELALLAGLSTDYYQRIEQGREVRPSDDVLDALAGALGLDDTERRHLFTLAQAARGSTPNRVNRDPERVPDSIRRLLRVMDTPAVILGRHLDLLDWTRWRRRCSATRTPTRPTGSTCSCCCSTLLASLHATRSALGDRA